MMIGRIRGEDLPILPGRESADLDDVVIVTVVEDWVVPFRVTVEDATLQFAPVGAPLQAIDTG